MKAAKNPFRLGHVYAGPEPDRKEKEEFEMKDVYGGPEQMGIPEKPAPESEEQEFLSEKGSDGEDLSSVPLDMLVKPAPIPPYINEFQAVYAGPDFIDRMRVDVMNRDNPFPKPPYPFNYGSDPVESGTLGKGMAGGNASEDIPRQEGREMIPCPSCGLETPRGRFCVNCGSVLK